MKIERYDLKYDKDIKTVFDNFYEEEIKKIDAEVDPECLANTIVQFIPNGYLMVVDEKCVGVLAGVEVTSFLNKKKIFQEIIWYINKPFRKYSIPFLRESIDMIRQAGFSSVIMGGLFSDNSDSLFRLYERLGFRALETHFIMAL